MIERAEKIRALVSSSREVLRDAILSNGAIVNANSEQPYYSGEAAAYRYVWPRSAAFIALAAEKLGVHAAEKFFHWLKDKPEGFEKEKLLYANYATNGKIGTRGRTFEPDHMGTVLWAISMYVENNHERALPFKELIERLCDGIVAAWNTGSFSPNTVDFWGDTGRQTSSRTQANFTYSLAACSRGLMAGHELFRKKAWKQAAQQMKKKIDDAFDGKANHFLRSRGKIDDRTLDASLVGLAWPFNIIPTDDKRMEATLSEIEHHLSVDGGLRRFEYDYLHVDGSASTGGGAWPILNFWMAIILARSGERERAEAYFHWVIDRVTKYIPEQIFPDFRVSVSPFVWSHAMFILACDALTIPISE